MLIAQNPYIAGNPVSDQNAFVGRLDVLRDVRNVLESPHANAIVLYGQRRIGKTSILQHLASQLPDEGPYHPVYFDLQDKAVWPLSRVLQQLANEISYSLNLPNPSDLDFEADDTFRQVFIPRILETFSEQQALVLLFDEFDVLDNPDENQAGEAFFPYLRELMAVDSQRLQFVFVIGRKPDDLDVLTLSVFKGVTSRRVSLLTQANTEQLIRLSQSNGTLNWTDEAVTAIWQLTNGHPYLTQQLCAIIWNQADGDDDLPTITPQQVEAALPETIESSVNALEWLWSGLASAERYVAAVLAQAGPQAITQAELEQLLVESGVRIVISDLQDAPQILTEWDLVEPTEAGYHFRVELLRRWIAEKKSVSRVQQELDRLQPLAETLYQAGLGFYKNGQLDDAINDLQRSLDINPNHLQAGLLLAQIYLEQRKIDEAVSKLEEIYAYNPGAARSRLVQALLKQVKQTIGMKMMYPSGVLASVTQVETNTDDDKLTIYQRILEVMPNQPEASKQRIAIWKRRGDKARSRDKLESALKAYKEADLNDEIAEVEQQLRLQKLERDKDELNKLERRKQYSEALEKVKQLAEEYPDEEKWEVTKTRLEEKLDIANIYNQATKAIWDGNQEKLAIQLLGKILSQDPDHQGAIQRLKIIFEKNEPSDIITSFYLITTWLLIASPIIIWIFAYIWMWHSGYRNLGDLAEGILQFLGIL